MEAGKHEHFSRFLTLMVEQAARDEAAEAAGSVLATVQSEAGLGNSGKISPKGVAMVTRNEIKNLLATNDFAVEKALVVMLERQTQDERAGGSTKHSNGIGYNRTDAEFGTSLGEQVRAGRRLTSKQLHWARKILQKYLGQLVDAAEQKAQRVAQAKRAADIW